jgi:hypothetical protein
MAQTTAYLDISAWDGFPPDPRISGWWWLQQADCPPCPAYWSADRAQWEQGGFFCGGSGSPEYLTSKTFTGGVRLIGACPEPVR